MVLVQKATNGIATRTEGAFANCGSGSDGYELSYSCQGPACSSLDVNFQNIFSLTSDGTKEGTQVDNEDPVDVCPNVQELPNSPGGNAIVGATILTGRPRASVTTEPLIFAGTSPRHTTSKSFLLLTSFLMLILLLPGSQGSGIDPLLAVPRHRTDVGARTVSDKVRGFAEEFEADLTQKVNIHGVSGKNFAHNLVADVVSSVCQNYFQDARPSTFAPSIARDCVASIYGGARLSQPDIQFLAVFGASLLCDYIVSETYTNG
ncbi:hypothetical protein EJ07DRAFT_150517 [Lizonia empirigonia]|nr:hypothetical protein EJ07DRAFT_150517 [Lizonia empirigonia]